MPNLISGWVMTYCLIWLCWSTGAPIVAEAYRKPATLQHICPMLQIRHGAGSDLWAVTKARDLCAG